MICHVSIDYDEDAKGSYRAVVLKIPGVDDMRWESGNPQADWAAYVEHAKSLGLTVMEASSIMHFCFDNTEWRFKLDASGAEMLVPEDRPEYLDQEPET